LHDVQSRVIAKIYPDSTQTTYAYDVAGRFSSMTDAKNQTTSDQYDQANHLMAVNYPVGTPSVTLTYDAPYGRLASMTDGIGKTTYAYVPAGQNGGLQLASEAKPAGYGTATFTYDQLGRSLSRSVDGLAETVTYDALGRITNSTNGLGNFTFGYLGNTGKLQSMAYPNGQGFASTYFGDSGSRRLQEMKQTKGLTVVSDQQFQYSAVGDMTGWQQENGPAVNHNWGLGYDGADHFTSVAPTAATTAPNVSQGFSYDVAGNWTQNTLTSGNPGAANADEFLPRVLQSGERTISPSTARALGMERSEVGRALEALKRGEGLPNNFHGNILSNGDYVHPDTGDVLGNLFDYSD
jgi:YD repeat-containing protein